MIPWLPDIGNVEESVLRQLPLHTEEIILNIAVRPVLRDPGNVVGGRVETGDQTAREPLISGGVAAWRNGSGCNDLRRQRSAALVCRRRSRLCNCRELRLRRIDARDIARTGARVVDIAGAETGSDDRVRRDRIGKSDARREVVQFEDLWSVLP